MAQRQTASITLAAASATAVCAAQTPTAGPLTINGSAASGGVATLDTARRVLVTTAGADAGKLLTITGTNLNGVGTREVVTLVSAGTVATLQDFKTVTAVTISANAAGSISVGTNGVASTRWIEMNHRISPASYGLYVNFGGVTGNVTVEGTGDVFERALTDYDMSLAHLGDSTFVAPTPFSVSGLTAVTTDQVQLVQMPVSAFRLTVNSGAASAGVRFTVIQAGG